MSKLFHATVIVASLWLASNVLAGEYFVYRDAQGRTTISNLLPPVGATVVRKSVLKDVTWEEVRARQEFEQWDAIINEKFGEIKERLAKIEEEIKELRARKQEPTSVLIGTSVGVTVRPTLIVPATK